MPNAPYSLTEEQLHRLHRAKYSIQVMANLLADSAGEPHAPRRISTILEMTSDDMENVLGLIERTYRQ